MKITATKVFTFDSAHFLPGHEGKCANLHGHTYRLEVTLRRNDKKHPVATSGSSEGMVMDFAQLKDIIQKNILEQLDHNDLTAILPFRTTAENVAAFLFTQIDQLVLSLEPPSMRKVRVERIRLWETPSSYVEVTDESQ